MRRSPRNRLGRRSTPWLLATIAAWAIVACDHDSGRDAPLARVDGVREKALRLNDRVPDTAEALAVGALNRPVERGTPEFARLVRYDGAEVVFKNEEGTGADSLMTPRLASKLRRLAALVAKEWPDVRVRVTEAWDERREHGSMSLHYEGRAADLTTSDMDPKKLGRLARLAVDAGFDWVFFEDPSHVHVSVNR